MEAIKDYLKNLAAVVGRMTPSQVMMFLGVVAGTIVGVVLLVGWANDITYSRLYSDLEESEAGEIASWLTDNKIPYQLSDGGRAIEIPSDRVYESRISLATQGLPRGGTMGYSIFDQNNLGMTDFLQNLNFRRALEGELTRTIMQLSEVKAARVHIVMPKERLFKEDQKNATASVVLKLTGNDRLSRPQIAGISHLVASSVEGLTPDNITIVDYNGNLLSSGQDGDLLAGLSGSQIEVGRQVEKHLEGKAQSMLDEVLGSGKSVVRVTAKLDFQQLERTAEMFDPNAPSVRSEERTQTSSSTTDKETEASESSADDNSETVITNYELNKTVEHIVDAVGTIDRLTVAVLVDGVYAPVEGEGGEMESVYQPRSPEELNRLEAIVKNAIGFDGERNDQVEIVNIAFDRKNIEQDQQLLDSIYMRDFYLDIARKLGYFLLVAVLFLYFRKKAKKLFSSLGRLTPAPRKSAVRQETAVAENNNEEVEPVMAEKRKLRLVDKMQETAKDQPEEIARVIKTMMVE